MENLRYGLIGCGRIAYNHLLAASKNNLNIVAICDVVPQQMERLISKCNLQSEKIKQYSDYRELLDNEELDLVAIATESGKHARIAMDCIKHRVHTIIEKPVTLSIEDAKTLMLLEKEYQVKVTVCHQNRYNKAIQKMRSAIEENSLGKLYYGVASIRWSRDENYYKQAPWRGTMKEDGGALMNQCIHDIDLLLWMMNKKPIEVMAYIDNLKHPYIEGEDMGIALVQFQNGAYGIIEGTTIVYPKNLEETLTIFGETGTIEVGGTSVNEITRWLVCDYYESQDNIIRECNEKTENVYGFGHLLLYSDMIDCIKNDRIPLITVEQGMAAMELVLAIYKSSKTKSIVKLPLVGGNTLDFINK